MSPPHTNTNTEPNGDVLMVIMLLFFCGSTSLSFLLYLGTGFRTGEKTSAVRIFRSLSQEQIGRDPPSPVPNLR